MFKKIKNKNIIAEKVKDTKAPDNSCLSKALEDNIAKFKDLFRDDDTFIIRQFANRDTEIKCCIAYIADMIDKALVNDNIIKPMILCASLGDKADTTDKIMSNVLMSNEVEKSDSVEQITQSIMRGDTVLFIDGFKEAVIISTVGWQTRQPSEPEAERVLRGPREGFTESLNMNLTMIRRRLSTHNLKFKYRYLGKESNTKICLCYIEGIVNRQILDELNRRLDTIDIDGITGSGTIVELIKDAPYCPFKTIGGTERPDVASGKLLEGHIAIVVDGTPFVLTVPFIFIEYFQSSEDYYIDFYYSSINRLLRIFSFILTISSPAIYIAMTTFHQEMIPTTFIRSITAARQGVPFPTFIEMLVLLLAFELLRETGIRMPSSVGTAISVVGGLVLGSAAVEARIVSAPVVIVVALTAITGLTTPKLKGPEILIRFSLLMLSSLLGLYGYIFGIIGLLILLYQLRSFGIPYMMALTKFSKDNLKDTVIRVSWKQIKYRPKFMAPYNRVRNNPGGKRQ
ncbi:spore germination protein KA [Ruminiclostridium sufflavum DSM 19573]|uniref:Spore germination protein KA n=1 Tax=Ruminiclostridium sufflavum DSM 19573 TaxID=1121337 RepID=A0A318XK47_9FIRM|nr:spore germination protein [Ruminiclostridium sufflavum]PYG87776.1 spore germination protein KA [Ruminiclostridium sufflavum DSM 19573]